MGLVVSLLALLNVSITHAHQPVVFYESGLIVMMPNTILAENKLTY